MDDMSTFLSGETFAVAGASTNPEKVGNLAFQALLKSGRTVFPLNPTAKEVEGHPAFVSLADLPLVPDSLSLVTPPPVTRSMVNEAIQLGVKHIWMQPGAEDAEASQAARAAGLTVIDDGSCILVQLTLAR